MFTAGENQQNLLANVENIDVEELQKFSPQPINLQGRINGQVAMNNYLAQQPAFSGNISTTDIKFNGDTLGKVFADVVFDNSTKIVTIKSSSGLLYNNDKTTVQGTIDLNTAEQIADIKITLNQTKIKTFENFFKDFIVNTKGVANGEVSIKGPIKNYKLDGTIYLQDFATKVIYLGTTYSIPSAKIKVTESAIDLGKITMIDELNNKAELSGLILHDHFNDLRFGKEFGDQKPLAVQSKQFQFLNTNELDNGLYYGTVIANGSMYVSGPIQNLTMDVTATTLAGSNLTLPIKGSFDASQYDYIQFKKYGEEDQEIKAAVEKNRLFIKLGIFATPDAKIRILMDPSTQEDIIGRGNGFIGMDIDLNNDFKMTGDYTITSGEYGFTFRNLVKKPMTIKPGGTIKWTGDPLAGQLNIEANYETKTNLLPLLGADASNASSEERVNYPTNVILKLSGPMLKPDIKYDISQPNNNDIATRGYAKLRELKTNDQALLLQVASLMASGQFINSDGGTIDATSTVLNTLNGVVSGTVSNILSQNINKLFNTNNFQVKLDYANLNSGIQGVADQISYNLRKGWLNDRIVFEVGDNIDYVRGTAKTNYSVLPNDFKFRYQLYPDGRTSVSLFRTTFTDISNSQRDPKIGIGFSYKKSFNHLYEIFKTKPAPLVGPVEPFDSTRGTF